MKLKAKVLIWCQIVPDKKGSFEDYLCYMVRYSQLYDTEIIIISIPPMNNAIKEIAVECNATLIEMKKEEMLNPITLAKQLRLLKPDIIHTHFTGPYDWNLLYSKMLWNGKLIVTDHSSGNYLTSNKILEKIKKLKRSFVSRYIDLYLPVSGFVFQRLKSNLYSIKRKSMLLYNGVDTKRFKPYGLELKRKLKSDILGDNNKKVIVYAGQLSDEKGFPVAIEAMKNILTKNDDCIFLLVGDGVYTNKLEKLIKEKPFIGRAYYLGVVSDMEVILNISNILIVPSQWQEAFGYIIAEAGACGLPVVASDIGGIPEIIINNETGLLVKPGCVLDLEIAINELLKNPDKHAKMSTNSRNHILKSFTLEEMIKETYTIYSRIIKNDCP